MRTSRDRKFYKTLAEKHNIPINVVEVICNSPFRFTVDKMQDQEDLTTFMYAYFGKIKLKNKFKDGK